MSHLLELQDIGLARMARAIAPELELHASTQMTITSPEALEFVNEAFEARRELFGPKRKDGARKIRGADAAGIWTMRDLGKPE